MTLAPIISIMILIIIIIFLNRIYSDHDNDADKLGINTGTFVCLFFIVVILIAGHVKIENNQRLNPDVKIEIIDGKPDTTYTYKSW